MRLSSFFATFALLAGLVVVAVPSVTSQALAHSGDCNSGRMCGWVDANYAGARQETNNFRDGLGSFNDTYSSLYNRKTETAWFSTGSNCTGHLRSYSAGEKEDDLSSWWVDDNDEFSSVHSDTYKNYGSHCPYNP